MVSPLEICPAPTVGMYANAMGCKLDAIKMEDKAKQSLVCRKLVFIGRHPWSMLINCVPRPIILNFIFLNLHYFT